MKIQQTFLPIILGLVREWRRRFLIHVVYVISMYHSAWKVTGKHWVMNCAIILTYNLLLHVLESIWTNPRQILSRPLPTRESAPVRLMEDIYVFGRLPYVIHLIQRTNELKFN